MSRCGLPPLTALAPFLGVRRPNQLLSKTTSSGRLALPRLHRLPVGDVATDLRYFSVLYAFSPQSCPARRSRAHPGCCAVSTGSLGLEQLVLFGPRPAPSLWSYSANCPRLPKNTRVVHEAYRPVTRWYFVTGSTERAVPRLALSKPWTEPEHGECRGEH